MCWSCKALGGFISAIDLLVYGSYFITFLLAVKAILFVIAEFFVRPKAMSKLKLFDRIRVTFIPLKNEESIFFGELKKLKAFRILWITIFVLLILRVLVALYLDRLEFT